MTRRISSPLSTILLSCLLPAVACDDDAGAGGSTSSSGADGPTVAAVTGSGASKAATSTTTTSGNAASSSSTGPLPVDPCVAAGTCPPGVWINVTPPDMDPAILSPTENIYGPGTVVGDPLRPSDMYVAGGEDGLWRSTDYGNTFTKINDDIPGVPRGNVIAIGRTTPATVWIAAGSNSGQIHKSTDGGMSFELMGNGGFNSDIYSIELDPNDNDHLISGLHEADGIVESTDGGETWHLVGGSGFPSGGVSWYPFFIDTGDPATTSRTWIAIAQGGATPVITDDGGATWRAPPELQGLQHGHGNAQIFQRGDSLFLPGVSGPEQGMYRSTDRGATWAPVYTGGPLAIAWGSPTRVYGMWAWACSNCDLGAGFVSADGDGSTFAMAPGVPDELDIGANHMVSTSDGNHQVFVGVFWAQGLWRYIEP